MRDTYHNLQTVRAISPVNSTSNTAIVSEIIDRQGFESLLFVLAIGAIAITEASFAVLVEHGNNAALTDAEAVPDAFLLGSETAAGFTGADDNATRKIGYVGHKRYIRLTITPSGNTGAEPAPSALIAAVAVLGNAHNAPV